MKQIQGEKVKKFVILAVIFMITAGYALSDNKNDVTVKDDSGAYYPLQLGDTWYYKAYKMSNKDKLIKVKATVARIEQKYGKTYYYFYAPNVDIRYLMRKDENGVYMKEIKYPFPIFSFSINVEITPEIQILKFPIKPGETWEIKSKAEASVLKVFKLTRNLDSKFECMGYEKITTTAGTIDTCHIKVMVDEGDGKGFYEENYWYGKNIGYTLSNTKNHHAELQGYKIFKELEKNEVITDKKPPEGTNDYK